MSALFPILDHQGGADVSSHRLFAVAPEAMLNSSHHATLTPRVFQRGGRFLVVLLLSLAFALVLGRAAWLQLFRGEHLRALAENNRTHEWVTPAKRGVIYDAKGVLLARNDPSFTLSVTPLDLPKDVDLRRQMLEKLAAIAATPPTEIDFAIAEFRDAADEAIPVTSDIPYERAMQILVAAEDFPGVSLSMETVRGYRTTPLATLSHVLGYTGFISPEEYAKRRPDGYRRVDRVGRAGVEASYEGVLHGRHGARVVEVDAGGNETRLIRLEPAVDGKNVELSIDTEFTSYIEERLAAAFKNTGVSRASVVAMDPRDGAIRALVSVPAYDNNLFSKRVPADTYALLTEDKDRPLFSRALSGEFPPGSTFKPTVASMALYDGLIDDHTSFLSIGGVRIGEWFFPDWKAGGHGTTDVRKAIAESVNTFFYAIGGGLGDFRGLGIERITEGARMLGFGIPTKVDLPGEADGFLPSKAWKESAKGERWYIGDTYHAVIGQGDVLVTPIQMANATATMANGGTRFEPRVVAALEKDGEREQIGPVVAEKLVGFESAFQVVREGMRQTVTEGSARSLGVLPVAVAAKTGTAQTPEGRATHAWFTSFAPYESPSLVITVLLEEGGEGSLIAAPIARDLYAWWFAYRGF